MKYENRTKLPLPPKILLSLVPCIINQAKGDIRICLDIRGTQIMRSLGWMATVVCMQVSLTHVDKIETRYGVLHLHMKLSEVHDTCLCYLSSSCEHKF